MGEIGDAVRAVFFLEVDVVGVESAIYNSRQHALAGVGVCEVAFTLVYLIGSGE